MKVYHGSLVEVRVPEIRRGEVNQSNVHLLLPWKAAGMAELWAKDLKVTPLEALMRLYSTKFYKSLEDESSKMWHYSPDQLYYIFTHPAA